MTEVKVGQVYEDRDPRAKGRRLTVLRIKGAFVLCNSSTSTRPTMIRAERLLRGSAKSGYRLVLPGYIVEAP